MITGLVGGLFVMLSSLMLYLASPNQRLGALPFAPRLAGWSGVVLLLAGTVLMLCWAGPATAVFIVLTLAMTVWSVVPLAVAWWRRKLPGMGAGK